MKLNVGCGPYWRDAPDGWHHLDLHDYGQDFVADVRFPLTSWQSGLNDRDLLGTVDMIMMNHVLHMVEYEDIPIVLATLRSTLKDGGVLRIIERDPVWAFHKWEAGEAADLPIDHEVEPTMDGKLCRYLLWHSTVRSLWTPIALGHELLMAGFEIAQSVPYGETALCEDHRISELDSREEESFVVEARK